MCHKVETQNETTNKIEIRLYKKKIKIHFSYSV